MAPALVCYYTNNVHTNWNRNNSIDSLLCQRHWVIRSFSNEKKKLLCCWPLPHILIGFQLFCRNTTGWKNDFVIVNGTATRRIWYWKYAARLLLLFVAVSLLFYSCTSLIWYDRYSKRANTAKTKTEKMEKKSIFRLKVKHTHNENTSHSNGGEKKRLRDSIARPIFFLLCVSV